MDLKDILQFQFKRVNPFQGLMIDTDIWWDAHNYHRDQQRLHTLLFHRIGIVQGLEVTSNKPPDLSVNIQPGIAIDPEGNVIIVSTTQHYHIQTRDKGTIYLTIQFREVPSGPYQPPDGGQPTRLMDAYRIQEREKLPSESYLELARLDFDPADEAIRDAKNRAQPGKNEINLSFRQEVTPEAPPVIPQKTVANIPEPVSPARKTITLGHAVLGGAAKGLHCEGLKNLVKEIGRQENQTVHLKQDIPLDKSIAQCNVIYLTGSKHFELSAEQQATLGDFLKSGGVIFGEGCTEGQEEAETKGAKEFGLAFNQLASQLKCKLEIVQRAHPLLSTVYVFSEVPRGAEPEMLLEGGRIVYSGSDYGCAWQGGHQNNPLPRDIIRSSFEMGANIIAYAQMTKSTAL